MHSNVDKKSMKRKEDIMTKFPEGTHVGEDEINVHLCQQAQVSIKALINMKR